MSDSAAHQGRCLCGHYRFQTKGDPIWVAYCHCESCRRFNGAPAAAYVGYHNNAVTFEPERPGAFASSPEVRRSFCEDCGTPLAYEAEFFPGETHLFRSNFDRPDQFEPTRHVLFNEREIDHEIFDDLPRYGTDPGRVIAWGPRPAVRVLFLCTGNSARSILAEGILNLKSAWLGERRIRGHSAGSSPTGAVNLLASALLQANAFRLDHLRSKSWEEFSGTAAPPIDWVITLCDEAAAESCPLMPGPVEYRHWGMPDPAAQSTTDPEAQKAVFEVTWQRIEEHVDAFLDELGASFSTSPLAPR
jgi:arsenate reductase